MNNAISDAINQAENPDDRHEGLSAISGASVPTNQQIIDAAKGAYAKHRAAVDGQTMALVEIVGGGSMTPDVTALDDVDWQGPGVTSALVMPFYDATAVKQAIATVGADSELNSFSVGVFSKGMPGGGAGTIGFDRDVHNPKDPVGAALQLDLFRGIVHVTKGSNLQFGSWSSPAGSLDDAVTGFFTKTTIKGVDVNLKILLTMQLEPYGFVSSTGAEVELPVSAGIFAGAASSPMFKAN